MATPYEESEDERPRKVPKLLKDKDSQPRLIVVLENSSLETVKVWNNYFSSIADVITCTGRKEIRAAEL